MRKSALSHRLCGLGQELTSLRSVFSGVPGRTKFVHASP